MARSTGKDGDITFATNSVAAIQSFTIDETAPALSATAMQDTYAVRDSGLPEWGGTITCYFDPADSTGQGAMTVGTEGAAVFLPVDSTTGSPSWSGQIIVSSINTNATASDFNTVTFNFVGNGALTKGTVA